MGDDESILGAKLERLDAMDVGQLKTEWRMVMGGPVPMRKASADLLRRALAYHLQSQACGGLSLDARRRIAELSGSDLVRSKLSTAPLSAGKLNDLKPGTLIRKTWRGETYEVEVLGTGFAYGGGTYGSLSKIARVITGVRWSGPAFFGLKKKDKEA